jgi:hypothetical protein
MVGLIDELARCMLFIAVVQILAGVTRMNFDLTVVAFPAN